MRIITVIKVFTIGFKWENSFLSYSEKFNVEMCVKLDIILKSITIKIVRLKKIIFTI